MSSKNKGKSLVLGYFYKKPDPFFWSDLLSVKDFFQDIVIFNCSGEEVNTDIPEVTPGNTGPLFSEIPKIKIVNFEEQNFQIIISEYFLNEFSKVAKEVMTETPATNKLFGIPPAFASSYTEKSKKIKPDFLLLLEDNEKLIIKGTQEQITSKLKESNYFALRVEPSEAEIFDYEVEPFTTTEVRLFSLKAKDNKDFLSKGDFYYQQNIPLISENILTIKKRKTDPDFEALKASAIEKEGAGTRENFFSGLGYFYKDSRIAEENFLKVLNDENENNIYRSMALNMLLKLIIRRTEYYNVLNLADTYLEIGKETPFFWLYRGIAYSETGMFRKALSSLHKSLKLKDNKPIIYNKSDLTWKIYKYLGELFFKIRRFNYAEKFLLLANQSLSERKSPEVFFLLGRLNFYKQEYNKSFTFFSQMFNQEYIPLRLLREAKSVFLNLLLFNTFEQDATDILAKEYFDKPEEILRVADTYYMNDNFEQALKLYLLSVKKFGVDSSLLFKLGFICSKLRILDQASYYFEMYLSKEPDDLDALSNLAFIYLNLEKLEEAEKMYLKVLKLNNFSFEATLHLSIIHISLKNKAKAQMYLEKAKTLNPASQEVIQLYKIFKTELK